MESFASKLAFVAMARTMAMMMAIDSDSDDDDDDDDERQSFASELTFVTICCHRSSILHDILSLVITSCHYSCH